MSNSAVAPAYQRHGLYYPYFHVRNDRWLKVAALYWPKLVRIVPEGYRTRDSETVRALTGNLITRQPPGSSVGAIAPRFADLLSSHADELRRRFDVTSIRASLAVQWRHDDDSNGQPLLTGVHASEVTSDLQEAMIDLGIAIRANRALGLPVVSSVDGGPVHTVHGWIEPPERELDQWLLMHPSLVAVYSSVLAEDFAAANMLQPTTDQESAYTVTNNWSSDRIAATLLDVPGESRIQSDEMPETLAFLALELVIPSDLDRIPASRIIDIRERYSAEFFAFGQAVDEAAASIKAMSNVRDQAVLEDYLRQVVAVRFAQPLDELRRSMKRLTGDAATMSVNVKTQLPAGITVAGGALLSGHPLVAGAGAVAMGLVAIRAGVKRQREDALQSTAETSYLLHTGAKLQPRSLLQRTIDQAARIAGTSTV